MIVAKFGAKVFEASPKRTATFESFSLSGDLAVSTQDAKGKKPATLIKGPGLLTAEFQMVLRAELGVDVQSEIDAWAALRDAGVPYPLVVCGKAVSVNKFLLKNCKASDYTVRRAGRRMVISSAALTLKFEEYLPPGAQPSAGQKSAVAGGFDLLLSAANPYNVPTTAEKSRLKRKNPGMLGGS